MYIQPAQSCIKTHPPGVLVVRVYGNVKPKCKARPCGETVIVSMSRKPDPVIISQSILVNGRQVHYLTGGEGEPLVLLHGHLSNAKTNSGLIKYLAEFYRVYAPDFPGFGGSEEIVGKSLLYQGSRLLTDWIIQERLTNFVLMGISMGGAAALYISKQLDRQIKGYVFLEPFYSFQALDIPKKILFPLKLFLITFYRFLPLKLGERLWSSKRTLLFLNRCLNPFKGEVERKRPTRQVLDILSCAAYRTFWQTIAELLKTDLTEFKGISSKQAVLLLSPADEILNYDKTVRSFQQFFPNLKVMPLGLLRHYPIQTMTVHYLKIHYSGLIGRIKVYLEK